MTKDYKIYCKDILLSIESIQKFVANMSFEQFAADDKTSSAVIRKFEIIGEAAKQIPEEIRQKYSSVPWKEMAGMRDKLIHFYAGVDYRLVWETLKDKLPALKDQIKSLL